MKKYIVSLIFLTIIFSGWLMSLSNNGPLLLEGILKRDFSLDTIKNRTLFDETESVFYAGFPFRVELMTFASHLENLKGMRDEFTLVDSNAINVAQAAVDKDAPENANEETNEADIVVDNNTYGSILIYNNDTALELNIKNEDALAHYAGALNTFSEKVDDTVNVYAMLIPTQIEFIDNQQIQEMTYSQAEGIQTVYDALVDVVPVNTYDVLEEHASEYIYFRTDHHWTQLGAYYGYTAFAKTLGLSPERLTDMPHFVLEDYVGSLYRMTQNESLKNRPDVIDVYVPQTPSKMYYGPDEVGKARKIIDNKYVQIDNKYAVFLDGDAPCLHIVSEVDNNESIVIIKDSYANAFIPFLTGHFKDVYVVDPRLWDGNLYELIREKDIDNVLFFNYALINRYDSYQDILAGIMPSEEE